MEAIGGTEDSHVVVIIEADEQAVTVYDRMHSERCISRQSFTTALVAPCNLVILVER
jgi:predicted double-glycine peptidase